MKQIYCRPKKKTNKQKLFRATILNKKNHNLTSFKSVFVVCGSKVVECFEQFFFFGFHFEKLHYSLDSDVHYE